MRNYSFILADPDYYEPLEAASPGVAYEPTVPLIGWIRTDNGAWRHWRPAGTRLPAQGWKIHVSSTFRDASHVLDIVTAASAELHVPFKHLRGERFFLWMHGKHADRVQSGKFITLYPPAPELAHDMLVSLERQLAGFDGPYILTDRRFGSSTCVSYRYGAFLEANRLQSDGTCVPVISDVDGRQIEDERRPAFVLPQGITDPFGPPLDIDDGRPVSFAGYTFEAAVQHSNSGGCYRARTAGGRPVFVKEARAHNGYTMDGRDARCRLWQEYRTLRELDFARPGLCPRPVEFFRYWENSYLVTEYVQGENLMKWLVANTPVIRVGESRAAFAAYYRRCLNILGQLSAFVAELHELGYAFVDLNPRNVIVGPDDQVRVVDFEAAQSAEERLRPLGAPGYLPPEALDPGSATATDPRRCDEFALSAIAQAMLFPLRETTERAPETLSHLCHDVAALAPVPRRLLRRALRCQPVGLSRRLPSPAEVACDPLTWLAWLRDRTASGIEAMAQPDNPRWVYPTVPQGLRSNTRCVAYGTAGVLHALRVAGRPVRPEVVRMLREQSLRLRDDTPPGLLSGNAGIAWVLADLGELDAADELLAAADRHPLTTLGATLAGGAAGVALAHLSWYGRTGSAWHLDRAADLLGDLPTGPDLTGMLGADDASGLPLGRPGIALALYYLACLSGSEEPLRRGAALLRDELRHALPLPVDALGFRPSSRDQRNMPYIYAGSAGYAHVLCRYAGRLCDPVLADALDRSLRACTIRCTAHAGLFQGQAGLALTLGQAAGLLGRPPLADAEIASGTALFKYAIPGPHGVRFPGDQVARLSADLWSGSAGVLLALHRMLEDVADPLFTLDGLVADRPATTLTAKEVTT